MNRHHDPNPFDEEEVNPFSNGAGSKSRIPPLASEPLGFGQRHDATVDIPLDTTNDSKKKGQELAAWEADLKRREKEIKRREDAVSKAGVPVDDKNWPPFFPIIHHDIANEIPVHAQRLQYLAFASWLGVKKVAANLSMRAIYQSKIGLGLMDTGLLRKQKFQQGMEDKFQLLIKAMLNQSNSRPNLEALVALLSTPPDANSALRSSTSTHAPNNHEEPDDDMDDGHLLDGHLLDDLEVEVDEDLS